MSDDADVTWNQDGEREEEFQGDDNDLDREEEEEEEEGEGEGEGGGEGGGRRERYDDEEEEDEDEDDEEDEGRPSKKRRKRSHKRQLVNRFLDVEAQVDSEDEPESSGDEGEDGFLAEPGLEGEGDAYDLRGRSALYQKLDREAQDREEQDFEDIAEQIARRHRRSGVARYTGDLANIPQRLLMPSVNDAYLWQVRVKPGKERDICFSLMRKAIDLEFSAHPLRILSAFQRDNLPGMIYIEARSQAQVQQALRGLVNVFPSRGITIVPIEEMAPLLQYKKKTNTLTPGAWVRIKRGKYQGDLAQVVDIADNGEEVGLRFIPRIDLNPKDEIIDGAQDGRKRKKAGPGLSINTRPSQRFFNVEEVIKVYGRKSVARRNKGQAFVFQNDTFKDGYIEKDIRISGIQIEDVNPTLDEITKFVKQQDGEENESRVDLSIIADASKKAAVVVLQPGDHVEVFEGEQTGVHGVVQSITGEIVNLRAEGFDLDGQTVDVEVPARSVRKKFKPGDHVKVMAGHNVDETGLVVSVADNIVTFLSDMSLQEVSVFSKDLREAAEVGASTNIVGNYELHDLVQLDTQTVGVIFKTERDSFRVLDQNGQIRLVQPHQITMGRDSRRAIATDTQGLELRVGDNVKEVDGEGRKGVVLHIHQSFVAFLYNREIAENSGVFITRARSLTSAAPKNLLKPGISPDLSKMNPAVGSIQPIGGLVGSGAGRGPRDRLVGIRVIVTKGTFKGYVGIVKDTNGTQVRVELNTNNKIITVERDKLCRPDPKGGKPLPLESFNRPMGPPRSAPASHTPNPYSDLGGSKTPAWGASGRTPNPYSGGGGRTPAGGTSDRTLNPFGGGRTPAWVAASGRTPNPYDAGGKTPAWNASARTPNPFADGSKTPAWNVSSGRTPNPYGSPGGSAFGGATPARGWGGATPGRPGNAWNVPDGEDDHWNPSDVQTPFSAPTPGSNLYSAPTPGLLGAPTPGPSGLSAPTPGMYGAPTPGVYGAPTPGFARTPGVAATPFVPGDLIGRDGSSKVDQETWLLDAEVRHPGLCVTIQPRVDTDEHWHDGAYDTAEGVLLRVLQVGADYTTTAQVHVKDPPRSDLPQEITIPVYFLAPVLPPGVKGEAVGLLGDFKGQRVSIIAAEDDDFAIVSAEGNGKVETAKRGGLCKWVFVE